MFGSTMGFSGSADRMALFPVSPNPRWRLGRHLIQDGGSDAILENSNGDISAADRPIYSLFVDVSQSKVFLVTVSGHEM